MSLHKSSVSKSKIKKLDGLSKNSEKVKAFLIGQIGKNSAVLDNELSLSNILDEIYSVINNARSLIGGRAVILECDRSESLINLYKNNHFEVLIDTAEEPLITMYTYITEAGIKQ